MSIAIRCTSCQHEYRVNERVAGKRVKCKKCAAAIVVPAIGATGIASAKVAANQEVAGAAPEIDLPKKPPLSRRIYMTVAILAVGGFAGMIYHVGREIGLWGQITRPAIVKQPPKSPVRKLDDNRELSRANLAGLGKALEMWSREHKGMYPPRLKDVQEAAELTEDIFRSPFAKDGNGQYVYLYHRSMGVAMRRDTVVAYDAAEWAAGQGANILYGSGDVHWMSAEKVAAEIQRSENQRLGLLDVAASDEKADSTVAASPRVEWLPRNPAKPKKDKKHRSD